MVAGSGTADALDDAEKLAVCRPRFALRYQLPGVGSKPVMYAMPVPCIAMVLGVLSLMVSPVASKL
jgi:hypothetical protein